MFLFPFVPSSEVFVGFLDGCESELAGCEEKARVGSERLQQQRFSLIVNLLRIASGNQLLGVEKW